MTDQPDFLNAVVALDIPLRTDPAAGATNLLVALKSLEREFGRRKRRRWGPRELDLDLLLFGRHRLAIERPPAAAPLSAAIDPGAAGRLLEVPHPSMRDRLFVLAPLADLAPVWCLRDGANRLARPPPPDRASRALLPWNESEGGTAGGGCPQADVVEVSR